MTPEENEVWSWATPRHVVANRNLRTTIACDPCRLLRSMEMWNVGWRLADEPIRNLRFRCHRCGQLAGKVFISRQVGGTVVDVAMIPLVERKGGPSSGLARRG